MWRCEACKAGIPVMRLSGAYLRLRSTPCSFGIELSKPATPQLGYLGALVGNNTAVVSASSVGAQLPSGLSLIERHKQPCGRSARLFLIVTYPEVTFKDADLGRVKVKAKLRWSPPANVAIDQ